MSYEEETERATESFRCSDPIQNFKIRVVLQPISSKFTPVPPGSAKSVRTLSSQDQKDEPESETEEYVFSWQEKIFSSSEKVRYSNLSNCKTKLQEKYHEEVSRLSKTPESHKRKLFTYVDLDNYKLKDEDITPVDGNVRYISVLTRKINNLDISGSTMNRVKSFSKTRIVNYSPSDDFKKETHLINSSAQKMFLMADLEMNESDNVKKNAVSNKEYVLCVITYDTVNKVLKMSPPFSKGVNSKPYYIGVNGQYSKNAYHYWLHHASIDPSEDEINNEKRIRNKIFQHQNEMRRLQVGNEFMGLSPNHINIMILGEIVSARDFEYDRLLIQYVTKLPTGWHCADPESLLGVTHTARTNNYGVAHFCHLFNLDLMFDLKHLEDWSAYLPEIFFEVLSIDTWKVYRNEGYGFITLPRNPGAHNFALKCWRASDNTVKSALDRFFLGGSQILEDVSYVGMGENNEKNRVMSRFGLKSIPSGSLEIRLNVIHQSEAFKLEKHDKTEMDHSIFGRFDTSNILGSVNAVLEAFRQARERMLKAKETLQYSN
ncbi:UNVERIFIED_CONTAM: hypothetical protein PYX00_009552 [Menopon gallinae]|uniref:Meckel syndrome type 1 protein n=1 Tax=Menopon gallinae TaxID=328185 RepID=A0AAW2HBS0_9NEOP